MPLIYQSGKTLHTIILNCYGLINETRPWQAANTDQIMVASSTLVSFPYANLCSPKSNRLLPISLFLNIFLPRNMASNLISRNHHKDGAFTTLKEKSTHEKEIKKSKFIAISTPIFDERSANSLLSEVRDPKATHNCWAYKIGDQFRSNDDGEPSGTAGKPILSAIENSGLDRVMVVVIRYFGGIKLGTGGLVRAYGGVAAECLRNAPTTLVKSRVRMGLEIPFDLLGVLYHHLQSFHAEEIQQDYETGKDGVTMVTFKVDFDRVENLEEAIKASCSRDIVFYKS